MLVLFLNGTRSSGEVGDREVLGEDDYSRFRRSLVQTAMIIVP